MPLPVVILLCLLSLFACKAKSDINSLSRELSQEEVEAFIGTPFPATATNLHTSGDQALDTVVFARFDLPQADLAPFLQDLGITSPLEAGFNPFFSSKAPSGTGEWWDLPARQEAISGLTQSSTLGFNLAIANPDGDVVTVYLKAFNQ